MLLLSVLMTAYNAEKYIADAIQSILNQTLTDFEFIILNDGSTDRTLDIIKSFQDERIRIIDEGKLGYYNAKMRLINESKGKYIAIMDADDISDFKRFEEEILFLESNIEFGLVGTSVEFIDENGNSKNGGFDFYENDQDIRNQLLFTNCIAHSTVIIRRSVIVENKLNYKDIAGEDYELWFQISKYSKVKNLNRKLLKYRIHANNMCHSKWYKLLDGINYIINSQLNYYFENLVDAEDVRTHFLLVDLKSKCSDEDLELLFIYVKKILEINKHNKVFEEKVFQQTIYERLLKRCLRLENNNAKNYKIYKSTKEILNPIMTFNLYIKEIAILIKSILNIKVK